MAVHGYITHAARNRRLTGWLFFAYVLSFELIGAFLLVMPLLMFDQDHTILSDPLGYLLRYGLPIAALSGWIFWRLYRGHAEAVERMLDVRIVTRAEEPRFVTIAEEMCTTLGVRLPRYGVIEAAELNAVTVGEGPNRGLIAVTRGLLERLDDDELAAVLAHEASHIRQGDTRLLAANHALMRTAVLLQVNNPLRFEDWRQLIIVLLMPPMLIILSAGSAATMASIQLARFARRGLKLGRDYAADGEAVRVTHFPEALLSALDKIDGRGAFVGSHRVEGLLFDGPADHEGGTHPAIADRLRAITTLGRDLMDPARQRRDTRGPARAHFGRSQKAVRILYPCDARGRPLERPPTPTLKLWALQFVDREAYRQWQEACVAWFEWRADDGRNAFGLTAKMVIPVAAVAMFMVVFYWPADNDPAKLIARMGPGAMVDIARQTNSGPFCSGPSYPDGLCPNYHYSPEQLAAKRASAFAPDRPPAPAGATASSPPDMSGVISLMLLAFVIVGITRPQSLRWLFGVVEAKPGRSDPVERMRRELGIPEGLREQPGSDTPEPATRAMPAARFGRKKI